MEYFEFSSSKCTLNTLESDKEFINNKKLYELFLCFLNSIKYCKEKYEIVYYKTDDCDRGMFIFEKQELKKFYSVIKKSNVKLNAFITYDWCSVEYRKTLENKEFLVILSGKSEKIYFNGEKLCLYKNRKNKMILFDLYQIFCDTGKFFPANLKSLSFINPDILRILLNEYMKENILFKDILNDYNYCRDRLEVPIKLELLWDSHSKHELLEKQSKSILPKSINRYSVKTGYLLAKSFKYVDDDERQKLLQIQKEELDSSYSINNIFFSYYKKLLRCDDNDYYDDDDYLEVKSLIEDYINMVIKLKRQFNLKMKSISRLIDEHNKLAIIYRSKYVKKIVIPKDSIFNKLNLPEEFQRIKTKKALIEESIINENCVASYDDRINRDRCAIFTRTYKNKKYTIEIIQKKQKGKYKFYVNQIYGRKNSIAPEELQRELDCLIEKENSKTIDVNKNKV